MKDRVNEREKGREEGRKGKMECVCVCVRERERERERERSSRKDINRYLLTTSVVILHPINCTTLKLATSWCIRTRDILISF